MTVQLEYINNLFQLFKNIFYYAGITILLRLSVTYYAQNYAGVINWSLYALVNL